MAVLPPTHAPAATAVTPGDLVEAVRSARLAGDVAEVRVLVLAAAWADAHPLLDADGRAVGVVVSGRMPACHDPLDVAGADGLDDQIAAGELDADDVAWRGVPAIAWDAPASFALANRMTTTAGQGLIRDALILRHRLPLLWTRVRDITPDPIPDPADPTDPSGETTGGPGAGWVPAWRARLVAQAVAGRPDDVCAYVDTAVAERAGRLGTRALDRLVDEAMARLYPEQREAAQLDALDACHVTIHPATIGHTGTLDLTARADIADLAAFNDTITDVAAALAAHAEAAGEPVEALHTRRAHALGVLADPTAALALLGGDTAWAEKCRTRRVRLVAHLSPDALAGHDPVTTDDTGLAWLVDHVRDWCGRPGTTITVQPLIDLHTPTPGAVASQAKTSARAAFVTAPTTEAKTEADAAAEADAEGVTEGDAEGETEKAPSDGYRPTTAQRRHVELRDQTCVFPWCTRPAPACDLDHITPYNHTNPHHGGETTTTNLAALCRRHHRLKTHAGWHYHRTTHRSPDRTGPPGITYTWTDPHGHTTTVTRGTTTDGTGCPRALSR